MTNIDNNRIELLIKIIEERVIKGESINELRKEISRLARGEK